MWESQILNLNATLLSFAYNLAYKHFAFSKNKGGRNRQLDICVETSTF